MISNEQRAHDLATAILATITKEGSNTLKIADQYVGLYAVILKDLDNKCPNGLPSSASELPSELNNLF